MSLTMSDLDYDGVEGEGAFAVVKRYRVREAGTRIAVKMLKATDSDSRRRFAREIELLRSLSPHPNIIDVLGVHDADGHPEYMMPLADGNLAALIARRNAVLSQAERAALFRQVCAAVAHAHERGVLHRDLAPPNVLIFPPVEAPIVRVADFGLGRDVSSSSSRGGSVGQDMGHVAYVAPEQRIDLSASTTRSDVYSLGRLLRFIMTGRDPDTLGECDFSHVVATATMLDPARRYSDASTLLRAFEEMYSLSCGPAARIDLASLGESTPSVDWRILHETIMAAAPVGHVYYEILAPLTNYFGRPGRLEEYQAAAGPLFADVVRKYVESMEACMALSGWPFSAMNWFGRLLFRVFDLHTTIEARKAAIEGLWMLAFEHDQWSVQDLVVRILRRSHIAHELDEAVAARIIASGAFGDIGKLAGIELPPLMRAALAREQRR